MRLLRSLRSFAMTKWYTVLRITY